MHNLMLDIETLGTGPSAIVTSVGAVFFDPHSGQVGAEFYRELNFQDQIDIGRKPTQSTIEFWFGQPKEAQAAFLREGKVSTSVGLADFADFINQHSSYDKVKPWGNGPSFDLTIMESLFRDFKLSLPWHFRNVRCLRTFKEYVSSGKGITREGIYHHALDDCKHQIKIIVEGLKAQDQESKKVIVAAKALREAQKSYMADRGNELKGQTVGKKAEELDLVLKEVSNE